MLLKVENDAIVISMNSGKCTNFPVSQFFCDSL